METIMTKIDLNNLDKSTWETFTFEEIASKVSETVDPNKTDLGIYVGLEHIDAEDIHIRRTGTPDDVNGQKLKCYPGDVIFGKRRAYQRKAAIVDFEGICSAHAFVLRANPEVIDPKLFPFFLHSDQFMHRAVDISVGGLSPTINWGDLKHQEFQLPPKDQQAQLAELLWTINDVIENENEISNNLKTIDLAYLKHYFYDNITSKRIKLKQIVSIKKGKQPSELISDKIGVPYCKAKYLRYGIIEEVVPENSLQNSILIEDNNIVVLWDGAAGEVFKGKKGVLASTMSKLTIKNKEFLNDYLFEFIRFRSNSINRASVGSVIKHVDPTYFNNILVPKLSILEQELIIKKFDFLRKSIEDFELKISSSQSLQKSLINQVF
ncbi:restriction endonuclease subunit S [Flavobacterium sp.]|jgi:type I restriction enzyme S subunit|uniref:restriction endonuclease subunit S n=1 Tax=Flavobacterium sp. TaxID=239 RepID=UPI0037BE787A